MRRALGLALLLGTMAGMVGGCVVVPGPRYAGRAHVVPRPVYVPAPVYVAPAPVYVWRRPYRW